jgi:uncharacterized membrane protein
MQEDESKRSDGRSSSGLEGLDGTGSDMTRLVSVSDGVFAFSLTFLVIELVIPAASANGTYPNLANYLQRQQTALEAYVLAFWIIASWWSSHRRLFSPIVRYDETLTRLNTLFLMIIAITPFLVGILAEYGAGANLNPGTQSTQVAVALYAAIQGIGGLILFAIWRHSTRNHALVRPNLPASWIRATERAQLAPIVVFLVSIPIAFVAPFVSEVLWILVIVGLRHVLIRKVRPARDRLPEG